jgi:regulator of protease activity HflC (stomatin/prohibitin superfamily)
MEPFAIAATILVILLLSAVKVVKEYERAVIFRLGRIIPAKGPGLILLIPGVDKMLRVSLRVIVLDVEKQDVITRDNVSVAVNAVVYFKVVDPVKALLSVEDFLYATAQLAQTTLRSVAGQVELDELLSQREKINHNLQEILDRHTEPWGIKVSQVEVKHIDLPQEMQRAMAKQAEAERERRAKIIAAEGEQQAAAKLVEAALAMDATPTALQLRYLQTLSEIAVENNSTTVFPIPMDLFEAFRPRFHVANKAWEPPVNMADHAPSSDRVTYGVDGDPIEPALPGGGSSGRTPLEDALSR